MTDAPYLEALTAPEVASILQVNRNTVYGLARSGALPSYTVGRKLRFSLGDVQAYIDASRAARQKEAAGVPVGAEGPAVAAAVATAIATPTLAAVGAVGPAVAAVAGRRASPAEGAFVIGGRDLVLDILANYLAAAGVRVLRSYRSGYEELVSLYFGDVQAAAVHLWDGSSDRYNLPYVKRLAPGTPVVVLHLATRTQGLLVRRNNPLRLRSWSDLVRKPLVLANRERGSGARVLLDERLRLLEADPRGISGYEREIASELAQGTLIARGGADAGVGTERVFHQIDGLDYVPLQTERLDLVIAKSEPTSRTIRTLQGLLAGEMLRRELVALPGHDFAHLGAKLYET